MRPTWTSPGRVDGPTWPCTGRGLPGRRVTAAPVRSYRTISPLPVRDSRVAAPSAVCFCGTFPRLSPGGRYPPPLPSGVRTFLERHTSRDCMACAVNSTTGPKLRELGAAGCTATGGGHLAGTDRAAGVRARDELVPRAEDEVLERFAPGLEE